jgi:hypothetical protein
VAGVGVGVGVSVGVGVGVGDGVGVDDGDAVLPGADSEGGAAEAQIGFGTSKTVAFFWILITPKM